MMNKNRDIYIIDYLHEFEYPELKLTKSEHANITMCKILYFLDRNHKTSNIWNKVKYTMMKRLSFELGISKDALLSHLRKLKKLGYINLDIDKFSLSVYKDNLQYAKYLGVDTGIVRVKAWLTDFGRDELYALLHGTNIPLQDEYIEILG